MDFDVPSEEAVRRLARHVTARGRDCVLSGGLVGTVTLDAVILRRQRPNLHAAYPPTFRGTFHAHGAGSRLLGAFRPHLRIRAYPLVLGGFALPMLTELAHGTLFTAPMGFLLPLMLLVGVGQMAVDLRWSDEDVAWLRETIQASIEQPIDDDAARPATRAGSVS